MHRRLVVFAALTAAMLQGCTGCGQGSSFPSGTISGRVTSLLDGSPLQGVTVTVALKAPVTTDQNGYYEIKDLPAGAAYRVRFTLDGHVARFGVGTLPDAAGDYPQGNALSEVNTALSPNTAGVTGKVYVAGGMPAAGAVVGVDLRGANWDFAQQVTAGADGVFNITGLPGGPTGVPVTVVVQPYDQDNDDRADYDLVQVDGTTFPDVISRVDVDLRAAANSLVVLSTNMDDGTHRTGNPLVVIFNRPVVRESVDISLTNLDQSRQVATALSFDTSGSQLTITPSGGNLTLGDDYRLSIFARAANSASGTFTRNFTETTATSGLGAVTGLTVRPASVDWRTTAFTLTWNPVANAEGYRVYVKDTSGNSAYQLMATPGSTPTPSTTVTLPANFDWYSGDGFQSPFANGVSVDFAVVPVDIIGNSVDPGTATAVRKSDNTAPRITSAVQNGNPDNSLGTSPRTVTLTVQYNEYMQVPGPTPTMVLQGGATATYEADPNLTQGVFTITVPAGANASGAYSIYGVNDSSGNAVAQYDNTLRTTVQIAADPGFESGALTSWSPTTNGTTPAPAIVTTPTYSGTYAVRLGNNTYGSGTPTSQSGTSQITQLMNVPSGSTQVTISVRYITYTNLPSPGHDYLQCNLYNSVGTQLGTVFSDYLDAPSTWKLGTGTFNVTGGSQIRLTCFSYQDSFHVSGGYIDDIQVIAN